MAIDGEQRAELVVCIDRGLVSTFAPGYPIHLLIDPADAAQVAVDRERSRIALPGAGR